ncbi:MAG: GxxExxY protein [Verrucomicrobia bacterium]|nr:GxxExxY protein [Verrucomicrobiota bacterium]
MKNEELTGRIIAAAITDHKALGPGFLESIYEEALAVEFDAMGIKFERQKTVPVFYRNRQVGEHRLDFLVEKLVVVELKAVIALEKVFFVIVRSYLKATNLESGLLFNFAAMPLTIKRIGPEDLNYAVSNS